jgi:PAS domain S-box-containing protein
MDVHIKDHNVLLNRMLDHDLISSQHLDISELESHFVKFPKMAGVIGVLLDQIDELIKQRNAAEELEAILQSTTEGIEAVDIEGKVKYVNSAFLRITQIPANERINQNIFEKNPEGLLAKVLNQGKPYHNVTTRAFGSGADCIASATPVYRNGEMIGAVIAVSDISNTIKIAKELEKSRSALATLYDKLGNPHHTFERMVGGSEAFVNTIELAKVFSQSTSTVLILGESGTGKELFAQAIYNDSHFNKGPFISVNCAAIPQHLLESELFGYEKGAFTGAVQRRIGMFELAHNGTIFLDEIGDLDYALQGKLLRALQENEFRRVGGNEMIRTNARVIAATNRPLKQMIKEGTFREDLYYRLNVLQLNIPPLRERKEDIPALVKFFIQKYNLKLGKDIQDFEPSVMGILTAYPWPGNIRELENVIERAINMSNGRRFGIELFSHMVSSGQASNHVEQDLVPIAEMEKRMVTRALDIYGRSLQGKKMAAKALGISLASLYSRIKEIKYKI